MTIINTETMEENPNMIYGDTNREIEDKGDMIMHYITTQANVIKALKLQIKEQKEDNKELKEEIKELNLHWSKSYAEANRLKQENEDLKDEIDGSG
mgnify:CR=1 FL=1